MAILIVIAMTGFGLSEMWSRYTRHRSISETVNLPRPGFEMDETLRFGTPQRLPGGRLALPLFREQDYTFGSSGKINRDNRVNLMLLDPASGAQNWLFDNHAPLILDDPTIRLSDDTTDQAATLGHVLSVVTADSNGDNRRPPDTAVGRPRLRAAANAPQRCGPGPNRHQRG